MINWRQISHLITAILGIADLILNSSWHMGPLTMYTFEAHQMLLLCSVLFFFCFSSFSRISFSSSVSCKAITKMFSLILFFFRLWNKIFSTKKKYSFVFSLSLNKMKQCEDSLNWTREIFLVFRTEKIGSGCFFYSFVPRISFSHNFRQFSVFRFCEHWAMSLCASVSSFSCCC